MDKMSSRQFVNKVLAAAMPIGLVLYAMMLVNQGLNVTDTGYNYGNFVHFETLDGMWKFSTYLATAVGAFFTHLPFGNTMLGLNFYTGLVKVATALVVYFLCVHRFGMKRWVVFLAELMALGYCWCPTALLYNYITYFLFSLGGMLLCLAVKENKTRLYVLAGLCLGINVMVRLPNLAEMALILALWIFCLIRRIPFKEALRRTGLCVLGYLLGIGSVLLYIIARYGLGDYVSGLRQLMEMSGEAGGYSLKEMLYGDILVYRQNLKWLWMSLAVALAGVVLYAILKHRLLWCKRVLFVLFNILLILQFRRMRMFDFVYYNYAGMCYVGVFFLIIAGVLGLAVLFFGGKNYDLRMQAMVVGIIIIITPLGSNNYLYSAENNLFFVTPFVFHICYEWFRRESDVFLGKFSFSPEPIKLTLIIMVAFALVQGLLFGAVFVFRDGIDGEKRTAQVENNPVLKGMYTTESNAKALQGLSDFLTQENLKDEKVILYSNVPGLAFYMELTPALSTTWPDLDSFSLDKFTDEMDEIRRRLQEGDRPLVILGRELMAEDPKMNVLMHFMEESGYLQIYSNEAFSVYY